MSQSAIRDFAVSGRPAWGIVAREVAAHLAFGVLFPWGIAKSRLRVPRARTQRTVVLVHGYLANRASFLPLEGYLRARGIKQVLSFSFPLGAGIEESARALRGFLRERVRGGRIDLVCHSLGGVIARIYLQELGGARRVDRCITLGTPHRGTYSSYWITSRVGKRLRPDSELLARLAKSQGNAKNVQWTSIVGGADNIIVPRVFAVGSKDVVHVPDVGHLGLLFSPSVFGEVGKRLLAPVA